MCGCAGRRSAGQGDFIAETTYRYVGKGKGDCMPLDYRPPPPVTPHYFRQFAGFTSIAALLSLVGWVAYGMIIGDIGAGQQQAPAALMKPADGEPVAAPAPSLVGGGDEAQPETRAAEVMEGFDCDADWDGTEDGALKSWAPDKLSFCCEHRQRGCAPRSAPAPGPHAGGSRRHASGAGGSPEQAASAAQEARAEEEEEASSGPEEERRKGRRRPVAEEEEADAVVVEEVAEEEAAAAEEAEEAEAAEPPKEAEEAAVPLPRGAPAQGPHTGDLASQRQHRHANGAGGSTGGHDVAASRSASNHSA